MIEVISESPLIISVHFLKLESTILGPRFFEPRFFDNIKLLERSGYELKKLNSEISVEVRDGPFGSNLLTSEYTHSGVPLLRVGNVRSGHVDINDLVFISKDKNEQLKRSEVNPGDVVVTKAGNLGDCAIFPRFMSHGNITSHISKVRVKNEYLDPNFLVIFISTHYCQLQIERFGLLKSTRPELTLSEVSQLTIPLIPECEQKNLAKLTKLSSFYHYIAEALVQWIPEFTMDYLKIEMPDDSDDLCFSLRPEKINEDNEYRFDSLFTGNMKKIMFSI